ncbi:hypothetical protein AMTRI_Chr10g230030 [Amborella trichopoda]|uniref:glycerophosphodiester phosphodiesterase n=1 Tax=Amborella trichopoda TaxID=13333 RepID=U5CY76_AMBTC|nr:glycerophosphodiester phosphodiesterase GDPDL3 [Amborella trichopoda]ERN18301.1 hypothetical protein AMTR_s00055p00174750 [Amborella trichopoda]|eukprot:XP_006856834.1 glycerophosphodiester phosphodiesterase GDPDL3 [Amborella trichopoda]
MKIQWGRLLVLLVALQLAMAALAQSPPSSRNSTRIWRTLTGNAPVVIARGGFSGLFPDSSTFAFDFPNSLNLPRPISWCDVQLTKDGKGVCLPSLLLDNCTNIQEIYQTGKKTYTVNGEILTGWFSIDFTIEQLVNNVTLIQGIFTRTNAFDATGSILPVEYVGTQTQAPGFWLNIQHDIFFRQHNLSMRSYVISVSRQMVVDYISSPDVAFLSSIGARFKGSKTKLVFRFLEVDAVEPLTNQSYGSLLKNLTFVKTFASGILVPKDYIWPTNSDNYLEPHSAVVRDAHKEGLEAYAYGFSNDVPLSHNYSYDPLAECLNYIDNGEFSVDGVLTDFPVTASEAVGCFSHVNPNTSDKGKPLVISHNGASGIYADSTDLAYRQAVSDGADVIDCNVQMTKDGTPICLGSIDLQADTTASSSFINRSTTITDIQMTAGIFSFDLSWAEIQSLQPVIQSPASRGNGLIRNPAYVNQGKFMTLSDFLTFGKENSISGILIRIEYAAYLAEKRGLGVIDTVITALHDAGYDNQMRQQVMIQSTDSSVLTAFKQKTKYKIVYEVENAISGVQNMAIDDLKGFADAVAVRRSSLFSFHGSFIEASTNVVKTLHLNNLDVYVFVLRNEFTFLAFDFFADPTVEIHNYVQGVNVDGLITEFPRTARSYMRNTCYNASKSKYNVPLIVPRGLLQVADPSALPPADAPAPLLKVPDVVEPPLPPVAAKVPSSSPGTGSAPGSSPANNGQMRACGTLLSLAFLLLLWSTSLVFLG